MPVSKGFSGDMRDYKTFWFREVTARGYPRRRAWSVIGMRVHEMLRYVYHHGVRTVFLRESKRPRQAQACMDKEREEA